MALSVSSSNIFSRKRIPTFMVCFLQHGFHGSISLNCLLQGPLPNTSPTSLYTRNCLSMICLLPKFLRLSHACVSMVCFQKNGSFPNAEIFKTCQNWLLVKLCRLCRLKVWYFLWNLSLPRWNMTALHSTAEDMKSMTQKVIVIAGTNELPSTCKFKSPHCHWLPCYHVLHAVRHFYNRN